MLCAKQCCLWSVIPKYNEPLTKSKLDYLIFINKKPYYHQILERMYLKIHQMLFVSMVIQNWISK